MVPKVGHGIYRLALPAIRRMLRGSRRVRVLITVGDEVLLVKNLISRQRWMLPGGGIHSDESPQQAAARELQEEIGFKPGKLTSLGGEFTAPGYTTEFIHLFLAEDLTPAPLAVDDDEFLEIVPLPLDEALRRVEAGEIQDGKTIAALLLTARRLGR